MVITLDQIVEETRHLPADVVAELVDRILLARQGEVEPNSAASRKMELHRRLADLEDGRVTGIPAEESLARMRKLAGL